MQLYTVREQAAKDLPRVLRSISELGFVGVELYGRFDIAPADLKKVMRDLGLRFTSAHVPFPSGREASRILDEQAELGVPAIAWSLEPEEFRTTDAIARGVDRVNEGAVNARDYGIRLAYHNHEAEFSNTFNGLTAHQILLDLVEPDVLVELDLYWAAVGGADPAEVLRDLGDRVPFVHVKDGPGKSRDDVMVAVGQGSLDIAAALTANPAVRWHIVELDRFDGDIFDALRDSYDFLVGGGYSTGQAGSATSD
ncbi:sugar phosphate isomerase/epimerase [Fodinicola feengrottensis]|uniref:Sugar phosphate isomerase/epimerase n=1 Tax=Fodinicola feengrottensis TaxID=435914 RepID=A0ABN2I0F5_9ACTN